MLKVLLIASSLFISVFCADWSYDKLYKWGESSATCDSNIRQSPIDLKPAKVYIDNQTPEFKFIGYNMKPKKKSKMFNSGYTVQIDTPANVSYITGGGLPGKYDLIQYHFHWSQKNYEGSEHTLNGLHYPLELHLVHKRSELTVGEALERPDGLAVLGVFFVLKDKEPYSKSSAAVDTLMSGMYKITDADKKKKVKLRKFKMSDLLPQDKSSFFRYEGSLTTPPCSEAVIWTVFTEPIPITKQQMKAFRSLKDVKGKPIDFNYRPVLDQGARDVFLRRPQPATLYSSPTNSGMRNMAEGTMPKPSIHHIHHYYYPKGNKGVPIMPIMPQMLPPRILAANLLGKRRRRVLRPGKKSGSKQCLNSQSLRISQCSGKCMFTEFSSVQAVQDVCTCSILQRGGDCSIRKSRPVIEREQSWAEVLPNTRFIAPGNVVGVYRTRNLRTCQLFCQTFSQKGVEASKQCGSVVYHRNSRICEVYNIKPIGPCVRGMIKSSSPNTVLAFFLPTGAGPCQ